MVTIIRWPLMVILFLTTQLYTQDQLQQQCLLCHQKQKIPSAMIYRRYLLKYSSKKEIKTKMFSYLKSPSIEHSIMPAQFFKKFPQKEATSLDDHTLMKMIETYIIYFDIAPKLQIVTIPSS